MNRKSAILSLSVPLLCGLLFGGVRSAPLAAQEPDATFDRIWQVIELYDNEANAVVQSMVLSGRFQWEYARVEDAGVTYDEWNVRRARFGVVWELFNQITLHTEAEFNPQEADPFYVRLTDFNVEWSRSSELALTLGKQGAPFTMDGATSSKELLTIDRSNLSNNIWFPQEYVPGLTVSGDRSGWLYTAGLFSSGDRNREFGDFSASAFALFSLGRDFAEALGVEAAVLRGDYVYQDEDPDNSFTRNLRHIGSVNFDLLAGGWGVRTDLAGGVGYLGRSDIWGATLMPFLGDTRGLQAVARVTYLDSADPNGVRLARYESQHTAGWGDRYQELYLGLNYFLYDHKLKVQSGVQFGDMEDVAADGGAYSGVSWTTGLRVSW